MAWGLGTLPGAWCHARLSHGFGLEAIACASGMATASAMAWALATAQANLPNGHKLEAMAQDIRYPGVRVGQVSK